MPPSLNGPPPLKRMLLPALFVGGLFYVTLRGPASQDGSSLESVLQGEALGTTWTVKLHHIEDTTAAQETIEATLSEVDQQMSTYRSDSELMGLNAHADTSPVAVSGPLFAVLEEAITVGRVTQGAFDVTVGPMVDAWGFGRHKHDRRPTADEIDALRSYVGFDKLTLDGGTVRKAHPKTTVDLSAIAKGHAVDRVATALTELGHRDLLVEIGGEFVARGHNVRGEVWRLGIERPSESERAVYDTVALQNAAMATSGDYRNVRFVDGQRLSHLIDPRSGSPITHGLASVTVIAPRCATADAWATALSVLGQEQGPQLAEDQGLAAHFIVRAADGSFTHQTTAAFDALR